MLYDTLFYDGTSMVPLVHKYHAGPSYQLIILDVQAGLVIGISALTTLLSDVHTIIFRQLPRESIINQ